MLSALAPPSLRLFLALSPLERFWRFGRRLRPVFRGVIALALGACFVWYRLIFFSPSSPLPARSARACPFVQSLALIFGVCPFSSAPTAWGGLAPRRSAFRLRRMASRRGPSPAVLIPDRTAGVTLKEKKCTGSFFFLDGWVRLSTGSGAAGEGRSFTPAQKKNRIIILVVEPVYKWRFLSLTR